MVGLGGWLMLGPEGLQCAGTEPCLLKLYIWVFSSLSKQPQSVVKRTQLILEQH